MRPTHRSNITLPEIFQYVEQFESLEDKVKALTPYKTSKQLVWYVHVMYNIDFSGYQVPEYTPNKNPVGLCNGNIGTVITRFTAACKAKIAGDDIRYNKLMTLTLESVSADEAKLLEILLQNKKYQPISKGVWKKLFPHMFRPEDETEETNEKGA